MSTPSIRVPVLEVFSSFQGEGPQVGERQVFVRLAGCDLRCAYCDTPESFPAPGMARLQTHPGSEMDDRKPNPMDLQDLLWAIGRLDEPGGLHARVSVTGGEPLLHPYAVRALAEGCHTLRLEVHVETGGHRPGAVAHVIDVVDSFTPDLKLESATGERTPWDAHRETYQLLARAGKALAVKAVVGATTDESEVRSGARFCAEHLPNAPFILQPVTPIVPDGPGAPSRSRLFRLHAAAAGAHPDARLIPQVHRALGVR